jgi:hypothetical protein
MLIRKSIWKADSVGGYLSVNSGMVHFEHIEISSGLDLKESYLQATQIWGRIHCMLH